MDGTEDSTPEMNSISEFLNFSSRSTPASVSRTVDDSLERYISSC